MMGWLALFAVGSYGCELAALELISRGWLRDRPDLPVQQVRDAVIDRHTYTRLHAWMVEPVRRGWLGPR